MPAEEKTVLKERRKWSFRSLKAILERQSQNFRVIMAWHIAAGLLGGLAGSYLGMYPYNLGATLTEVGYLTSINALSACLPALLGGALAQKYGRKRLILWIWPSYVFFYIIMALAPSWHFIILAYLIYSIAYAGDPALGSLYADSLDQDTRAEAISLDSTISGILSLIMPPIGGFLIEYFGGIRNPNSLRPFYGLYAAFHAMTLLYFWKCLRDDGFYENDKGLWKTIESLGSIFKEGRLRRYLIFTVLASLTSGLSAPFVTIYIFSELGASPTFIGLMASLSTGLTYLALNLGALWSDRIGRKVPMGLGYLFSASALMILSLAKDTALLIPYYIASAMTAIGGAASSALIQEYVPQDLRSRYFGTNEAIMLLCLAAGPTIGGVIYASYGARALFWLQAFLQGFLILPYFFLAIPETRKPKERHPARFLRRPRIPSWLVLHPKTHH
jgi:MFS family permease